MMLVSLISYIDRNTLALLAPAILAETGLTGRQYGFVISAFSIAYMAGNPIWGHLLDRIGIGRGMFAAVSLWTLASAAHALARGPLSFGLARAALGFGEGATFPGGLRAVVQTLPPAMRSRGTALAYSGGSLGAVITPLIVTPVAAAWGWRGAFWFTGLIGVAWLALWALVSRRPDIRRLPAPAGHAGRLSLRDPRLWSFMAIYALGALPLAFVIYGASLYLSRVLGKTQIEIGRVLWIPPLGWEIGYFVWGWITDRFAEHGASIPRMRLLIVAWALLGAPLALVPATRSEPVTLAMLFYTMFVASGYIIGAMSYATSLYSSRHAGFIAGLGAGAWSAAVALIMPVFGHLFDGHHWSAAFTLAAAFPFAGSALWLALNRRVSPLP